jgi:hypothetical protein
LSFASGKRAASSVPTKTGKSIPAANPARSRAGRSQYSAIMYTTLYTQVITNIQVVPPTTSNQRQLPDLDCARSAMEP